MYGSMMDTPLLISSLLDYAARYHGDTEIVTRTVEGPIHRYGYGEAERRSRRLAAALRGLGVEAGERVGTVAWNTHRHFELYFAISGLGAVCHTLNPRLFAEQMIYVINHAEDVFLFVDLTFVPLLEALADQLPTVRGYVIMTDAANMPQTSLPGALCYETLLADADEALTWPQLDEHSASGLCYTSGTTGHPKGVLYSHRSTVLHAWSACMRDTLGVSSGDTVLPVVPMFHVNAWGVPYAAAMCGAKLIFPGPQLDGASVHELIDQEQASILLGVPTIWLMLLAYLKDQGKGIGTVERVVIGGSAAPRSMIETFQNDYGVEVLHAWGMTETSPLGTVGTLKHKHRSWSEADRVSVQCKQGRGVFGVEMKIVDEANQELPRDGRAFGELKVRGPWVARAYFKDDAGENDARFDDEGWFATGDVATLDPDGYMQITDRTKDVIKSGGEWISSIDLENTVVGHPSIAEAAVIGIAHPKWSERPLVVAVAAADEQPDLAALHAYLEDKVARWWLPDDVVYVDELPHTATGKISKRTLRQQFHDYVLPSAE